MIVEGWVDYGMPQRVKFEAPDSVKPRDACYYDLLRVPHGHTPAPMAHFWGWLPIPVKGVRDSYTFSCPNCGEGSFFKTYTNCPNCRYDEWGDENYGESHYNAKREKWRRRLKDIEYALLPLLILLGKAWYMPSIRGRVGETLHVTRIPELEPPPIQLQRVSGPLDTFFGERTK